MKPSNPPAFPRPYSFDTVIPVHERASEGMSLRDYFAAAALQGWMATYGQADFPNPESQANVAGYCYSMAEALLTEREKNKTE